MSLFNLVTDVVIGLLLFAGLVWRGKHPYLNGALAVIFAASMGMRMLHSGESVAFASGMAAGIFFFWLLLWFGTSDRVTEPINHSIFLEMMTVTIPLIGFGSLSYFAYESWRLTHKNILLFVAIMLGLGFVISVWYEYRIIAVLRRRLRHS